MKKLLSLSVLFVVLASLTLCGCEQKSDAEKALDSFKKDVKSMTN